MGNKKRISPRAKKKTKPPINLSETDAKRRSAKIGRVLIWSRSDKRHVPKGGGLGKGRRNLKASAGGDWGGSAQETQDRETPTLGKNWGKNWSTLGPPQLGVLPTSWPSQHLGSKAGSARKSQCTGPPDGNTRERKSQVWGGGKTERKAPNKGEFAERQLGFSTGKKCRARRTKGKRHHTRADEISGGVDRSEPKHQNVGN